MLRSNVTNCLCLVSPEIKIQFSKQTQCLTSVAMKKVLGNNLLLWNKHIISTCFPVHHHLSQTIPSHWACSPFHCPWLAPDIISLCVLKHSAPYPLRIHRAPSGQAWVGMERGMGRGSPSISPLIQSWKKLL